MSKLNTRKGGRESERERERDRESESIHSLRRPIGFPELLLRKISGIDKQNLFENSLKYRLPRDIYSRVYVYVLCFLYSIQY